MMKDEDYKAMCELALELTYRDAIKFVHDEYKSQVKFGDATHLIERLAKERPNTVLGQSFSRILLLRETS